jgi:hypothetical protein
VAVLLAKQTKRGKMGAPGLDSETWESKAVLLPWFLGVSLRQMPKGLVRYQQTGDFHFLTFSCYRRLPYLRTVSACERFEAAFERMRLRYNFVVAGYVVMPEAGGPGPREAD